MIQLKRDIEYWENKLEEKSDIKWRCYCEQVKNFRYSAIYPTILNLKISLLRYYGIVSFKAEQNSHADFLRRNKNIEAYYLGSRAFGEAWLLNFIMPVAPNVKEVPGRIKKKNKFKFDAVFYIGEGEKRGRISFGASRATDAGMKYGTLAEKSLKLGTDRPYTMNFQHVKSYVCDVFVWSAIFADGERFWVLTPYEVDNHKKYINKQARRKPGEGASEGQLFITSANIQEFERFEVNIENLNNAIYNAIKRQFEFKRRRGIKNIKYASPKSGPMTHAKNTIKPRREIVIGP